MIRARYERDKGAGFHHLLIRGHADAAPHGHDIVCAGVSAIAFALMEYIAKHEDHIISPPQVEPGMVEIFAQSDREGTEAAFEVAAIGLKQLAIHHPHHVEFEYLRNSADDTREKTPR